VFYGIFWLSGFISWISQAQVLDNDEDFEKKGVIVVDLPIDGKELSEDEAMNLAIEIGAEDVIHEIDSLKVSFVIIRLPIPIC